MRLNFADTGKSLLKSYKDWLRLIVGHFDATEHLVLYVTSDQFQRDSISIKILVAPPTDSALLPWRQLFENKFLPEFGAINALSTITNEDILEFLNNGISMAVQARNLIDNAELALGWLDKHDLKYETTQQALQYLATNATNKTAQDHATTIIKKLQEWNDLHNSLCKVNERPFGGDERRIVIAKKAAIEAASEIADEIRALRDELGELDASNHFFLNLENPSFDGTLHCEACLASLLPAFTRLIPPDDRNYKEMKILSEFEVAYPLFHPFPSFDPYFVTCHIIITGLWARDWAIKTLLSCLRHFPQDLDDGEQRRFCSTRQLQQSYSVLSTAMDSKSYRRLDE